LTASERLTIDVETELAALKGKLSGPAQAKVRALLEETVAVGKLSEAQQKAVQWQRESAAENIRAVEAADAQASAYEDQLRTVRLQLQEYGLTREQLRSLEISRIRDASATLQQRAAAMASSPAHAELVEIWQRQARALNDLASARAGMAASEDLDAGSASRGLVKGIDDYIAKIRDIGPATRQAASSAAETLEDDLLQSFRNGKLDVSSFIDSVISEFLRLQVIRPLLDSVFSGAGGALSSGLKLLFSANGNAFGPNGPITAFADGGVVNSPTMFRYSGGTGVMGEAGEEGIFPLERDSRGKLGVRATGGGSSLVHHHHYNVQAGISRSEVMAAMQMLERRLEGRQQQRLSRAGVM
jgi:lambda family phage tail tape measure protein